MIRVILLGRTGNNMFQYALGRVLARRHGTSLALDGSWFNAEGWAEVSHFLRLPLKATVCRRFSLGARALRKLTGKHYWEYRGVPLLREHPSDHSFDPSFLEAPADCVLMGYFQSPRYFESMAGELREELKGLLDVVFRGTGDGGGHEVETGARKAERHSLRLFGCDGKDEELSRPELAKELRRPDSAAVHVRRGDYLWHACLQVCDEGYYRHCMETLRERVPGIRFFLFSDDPEWCRQTFSEGDVGVVDSGSAGANPLHDLWLMSQASHVVMSNSSYSWWAAWLGEKPGRAVLMPERWHAADFTSPIEEKKLERWEVVRGWRREC